MMVVSLPPALGVPGSFLRAAMMTCAVFAIGLAFGWLVEPPNHVEERALAGTGRPHDGHVLSSVNLYVHSTQGMHLDVPHLIQLLDALSPDDGALLR